MTATMPLRFRPLLGFVIVLAVAAGPSSARAIVNGELAGGQYPAVGTVIVQPDGGGPMFHPCSGFLISSTAFATAGHCVVFAQALQDEVGGTIGVSFDSTFDPDTSSFVAVASATIHPEFLANQTSNKTPDMAVLALEAPIEGVEPIELPEQGAADRLSNGSRLTTVGYGATRDCTDPGPCQLVDEPARRFATETLNSVSQWFITVNQNPASGEGGVCFMDSGGPHLLPGTNTSVAMTTAVPGFCSGASRDIRIDTATALSFLSAHLGPSQ
jgi:Trypsin